MKLLPAQWYGRRIGETGGTALKTLWLDFEFCHFVNKFNSLLSSLLSEQTTPLKNAAFLCCWFILFIRNKDTNAERVLALVILGHTKLYNNMFVKQPPQRDLQMAAGQTCFRTIIQAAIQWHSCVPLCVFAFGLTVPRMELVLISGSAGMAVSPSHFSAINYNYPLFSYHLKVSDVSCDFNLSVCRQSGHMDFWFMPAPKPC